MELQDVTHDIVQRLPQGPGKVGKDSAPSNSVESCEAVPQDLTWERTGTLDALDLNVSLHNNRVMSHTPQPGLAAILGLHA